MLFTILDIFFRILIIVLLIRFFIEKYQYYGYGPVLYAVMELTNKMLLPLRQVIPPASRLLHQYLPLTAIGVVVLIRGFFLWVLGSWHPLQALTPTSGMAGLVTATGMSAAMAVMLVGEMLILFLFASMMVSRYGIMACSSAGYMCFQEKTFAIFQWAKKYIKSNELLTLFLFSAAATLIVCGALSAVFTFSYFQGLAMFYAAGVITVFEMLSTLIFIYTLILLLSILASWIGADQFSLMIQIIKAMTEPYLNIFRRWFPWMRIDFVDLSPIFAFIALNPILIMVLEVIKQLLLPTIMLSDPYTPQVQAILF